MKVEMVAIDSLTLDPKNARSHPEKNIAVIIESLRRFGQQKPIVVSSDGIVRAGNGTLIAAKHLGMKKIAVTRSDLEGDEATAFAIADNRSSELAAWDTETLAEQLASLQLDDASLMFATGFDANELNSITGNIEEEEKNSVEEEWTDMPEWKVQGEAERSIVVHFRKGSDAEFFATQLGVTITPQTKVVWWES